jgi:hypothetical protein
MQVVRVSARGARVVWQGERIEDALEAWHAARRRMRRGAVRLLQGDEVVRETWVG